MLADPNNMGKAPRILFLVTEDWYFCSHRLHLACAARDEGMRVYVATQAHQHGDMIEKAGLSLVPVEIKRGTFNPLRDIRTFFAVIRIYRRIRPDIVHHVAMKPVLYGSLAARIIGVPHVVNAMAGMGFVFSSSSRKAVWLRPLISFAFRCLLGRRGSQLIVQNPDDRDFFIRRIGISEKLLTLIAGSGVDISCFCPTPPPSAPPVVVTLVARILKDKGVREFVDSIRLLKQDGVAVRAVLVGEEDMENPAHISHSKLLEWVDEGVVEWLGRCEDIPDIWANSHIAVLPSYREGLPKSLLEAAACARPIVATDVPGCREIVKDGINGLLVKPRDPRCLADALRKLINDEQLRIFMGQHGRKLVEQQFSNEKVQRETLALYQRLLTA